MQTFIALLRGINVGGQKKNPMAELRSILNKTALKNVSTYIQTGNIFFQTSETNTTRLEELIHAEIKNHFGFEVDVLIVNKKNIQSILAACPFSQEQKEKSYFTLLYTIPNQELIEKTALESYPGEVFKITRNCVYFYSDTGYGNARCNNNFFEKKLKVIATTRNYKTMIKLLSLSEELQN